MPTVKIRRPQDIAAVVRTAREGAGLSQSDLARRLAISRDYMISLESRDSNLYISRLFRVLNELGVKVTLTYGQDDA